MRNPPKEIAQALAIAVLHPSRTSEGKSKEKRFFLGFRDFLATSNFATLRLTAGNTGKVAKQLLEYRGATGQVALTILGGVA